MLTSLATTNKSEGIKLLTHKHNPSSGHTYPRVWRAHTGRAWHGMGADELLTSSTHWSMYYAKAIHNNLKLSSSNIGMSCTITFEAFRDNAAVSHCLRVGRWATVLGLIHSCAATRRKKNQCRGQIMLLSSRIHKQYLKFSEGPTTNIVKTEFLLNFPNFVLQEINETYWH